MSTASLSDPLGDFLYDCFQEYRASLPNNGQISPRLWKEKASEWGGKWVAHRAEKKKRAAAFEPPTASEVTAYSIEIGYPLDGEAWCLGYAQKGWKVGNSKMVNWKLAVQKWKREGHKTARTPSMPRNASGESSEPKGWLEFMRETRPNWTPLHTGNKTPKWGQVDQATQRLIIGWMEGEK